MHAKIRATHKLSDKLVELYMRILKTNITQQVFEYLKENIEHENWPIGSKIPSENELTKLLSVSRSSVRMAIQQCITLGILESQHGRGTFVKHNNISSVMGRVNAINEVDYDDIYAVLQFRKIIEQESAYMAATRMTEKDISLLEEYFCKMKDAIGHPDEFVDYDMMFHQTVANACGNAILASVLADVISKTEKNLRQINDLFGYKDGIYYHTLLLKAFKARDAKKAKYLMGRHLKSAMDRMKTD